MRFGGVDDRILPSVPDKSITSAMSDFLTCSAIPRGQKNRFSSRFTPPTRAKGTRLFTIVRALSLFIPNNCSTFFASSFSSTPASYEKARRERTRSSSSESFFISRSVRYPSQNALSIALMSFILALYSTGTFSEPAIAFSAFSGMSWR